MNVDELKNQAQKLPFGEREQILTSLKETELHGYLKSLYSAMEPAYHVEVTHGANERGNDLVLVKYDNITVDVIGVVVKCGDISGGTLRQVDDIVTDLEAIRSKKVERKLSEVISQIKQSTANPAALRSSFQKLSVNKVMVIIAGKMSISARERIEHEVAPSGQVHDLGWLVDQFTNHYPQVFFDAKAFDFILERTREFESRHLLTKGQRNLSDYYIEPLVSTLDAPVLLNDENLQILINPKKVRISSLKEVTTGRRRIILAGDPGSGKSAALVKLSIDILRDVYAKASRAREHGEEIDLPVLVTAKDLLATETPSDIIALDSANSGICDRFHPVVLMVDGLDEVAAPSRAAAIEKASKYADILGCALVLASRKIDIIKHPPPGFEKFELLPFELGQAVKLYEKLLSDKSKLVALRQGLEKIQRQIPIVPLSLVLLLELVEEHQELPSSVTELYDRFVDLMLGREDRSKGIEVLFDYLVKKRFLSRLAFEEFILKGRFSIPRTDLDVFSNKYVETYGLDPSRHNDFMREIERAGVLDLQDVVQFGHRSFLDYFSAVFIHEQADEIENVGDTIVKLYYSDEWSDVAFFYVGLRREMKEPLLDRLLSWEVADLSTNHAKLMIGRLLQAGWHSTSSVKYKGVTGAFGYAPVVRRELMAFGSGRTKIPRVIIDFLVLKHSEMAFQSGFLEPELRRFYFDLMSMEDVHPHLLVPLIWVLKVYLSPDELENAIATCVKKMAISSHITVEDEASVLLILSHLIGDRKNVLRSVGRRLKRLEREYPSLRQAVLPATSRRLQLSAERDRRSRTR